MIKTEGLSQIFLMSTGKYYLVEVFHQSKQFPSRSFSFAVRGYLLNYSSGDIVLYNSDGVFHIKNSDIVFMRPIEPFAIEGV